MSLRRCLAIVTAALGLATVLVAAPAQASPPRAGATIVNGDAAGATTPFDTDGNAIDAHDGQVQRFGDTYYLYGTTYGCGFTWQGPGSPFCGFSVYSSTDFRHWTKRGPLFDASTATWQQRCNGSTYGCFRPHVVFDRFTHRYVLWINSYDNTVDYHVFTSARPTGPFVEAAQPQLAVNRSAPRTATNNGDHDVFVDTDGTAYLVYTDWVAGGDLIVEQLDRSYLTGTGRYTRLGLHSTEAPSMFERDGTYYLTYSDPNCGYCAGTGTSYLTASSPLGPWHGSSTSGAWQIHDGQLQVDGGEIGLSRDGSGWGDYTMSFDATPLQAGNGSGTYAQAGWVFRAADTGDGYAWLLGNYPYAGAERGSLTKIVFKSGAVASNTVVPLPFAVTAGTTYHVSTAAVGSTITTTIDGQVVDTTTDTTYAGGRVGFREGGSDGEQARFDNVRVVSTDGSTLLTDDFSGGLGAWDRPLSGTSITTDSCGGQPDDVAVLPGTDGPVYLYASDRWVNQAHNQSLATQYREPLRFDSDGSIQQLQCLASVRTNLLTRPAHRPSPRLITSGDEGFHTYCDLRAGIQRAQTFTVHRTGVLREVQDTTFRSATTPNGDVTVSLATTDANRRPATVLASTTVPAAATSLAPASITLPTHVRVRAGQALAIVVSSTATSGCYGMSYSDDDPYAGGAEFYSSDGGTTWRAEPGRDLHVRAYLA